MKQRYVKFIHSRLKRKIPQTQRKMKAIVYLSTAQREHSTIKG